MERAPFCQMDRSGLASYASGLAANRIEILTRFLVGIKGQNLMPVQKDKNLQLIVPPQQAPLVHGLSARILALTVLCLLLGEVLIFVPSISRFREVYLQERIAQAHLATLVPASTTEKVDADLEAAMLAHTGAKAITVISDAPELMLGGDDQGGCAFRSATQQFRAIDHGCIRYAHSWR